METTNSTPAAQNRIVSTEALSIMDMIMICLRHWPWFILSLLIFMGAATLYLMRTPKTYTRTMSVLVKSGSAGKTEEIRSLEELGVGNLTTEISDEIVAIHSPAAIYDMVKRLHLDFSYFRPGYFRNDPLYAESLPVEVELPDLDDNATASFTLTLNGDETATLSKIVFRGNEVSKSLRIRIGKQSKSLFGAILIKPTIYYNKGTRGDILVQRIGFVAAAGRYGAVISASLQPNTKNIIDVRCVDNSIPRAENILKTIINIYNENWVKNRNQISVSTNEFIKERLAVIEEELGDVDQDIAGYKSANAMPDVMAVAAQAMGQQSAADQERQVLNNQLYMVRYVRNYVTDPTHAKQLLPASTGIGNSAVEAQIASYNEKLLERNNLVANSSEKNPLVGDLDVALNNLRGAIVNSLDNAQTTLTAQLSSVQSAHSQAVGKLSANPQQANHLLSIERQQKVKESLYLFLLQKREENELSQAFTAYNTRIIADPWGSNAPTSPDRNRILLFAFAIAMAIPAAFFILREMNNSKVRGRKDLENLTIPFVGELPLWKPRKGEELPEGYHFVVRQHSRDITNEAYRVVRTNLEFMMNSASAPSASSDSRSKIKDSGSKGSRSKIQDSGSSTPPKGNRALCVQTIGELCDGGQKMEGASNSPRGAIIMLTSFNPGSGKTFITANLGASFAIRNSRVICIDLDLRRGSLSEFAGKPKKGLTNFLSGQIENYQDVIVHIDMKGTKGSKIQDSGSKIQDSGSPLTANRSPLTENPSPLTDNRSPLTENPSPLTDNRSPLTDNRSPLTANRSPLTENPSPLTDNRSPITDNRSPLTANRSPLTPQLDILPIGKIPPNPTELLYSPKLKSMFDDLRQHYDYIFVDCPPVEIVADATIISHESDLTIFVIRAGLLDRSMLPELQKNYDEKKYNNMAMLLNGTDAEHHYGYHRYGYGYGRYGYGYGKRYGYGYYGYGSKK